MLLVPKDELVLLSSNVPTIEDGIEVFDSSKTYNLGKTVQKDECIFESVKSENKDVPLANQTSPSWLYKGKVNKLRMFDDYMSTVTKYPEIICEFRVSDIDTVAFFNLQAISVKVELYDRNEILLYSLEKDAYKRNVTNWYEWTVQKPIYERTLFFKGLPFTLNCRLKITIKNPNDFAQCGYFMYGRSLDLGLTLLEPKPTSSIRNLLSKERQSDGTVNFSNSRLYKRVTLNVVVESFRITEIQNILEDYTVTPCLFIGVERDDSLNALTVFGFYKDFDKPIGLDYTQYQIEIEGIV
ncbi:MAG: hypothetical protein DI602_11450 [Aliarcobacter butzleri]|nr:MAG: hypothetical protein DI602_11450 [Aliarcobacter butzleri]